MHTLRKNHFYLKYMLILTLFCFICCGCAKKPPLEKTAIRVNSYTLSADEFNRLFSELRMSEDTPQVREAFLEKLINRKLILQEAQKKGLDKKEDFLKSIENFWEQSLLAIVIDKKVKEISGSTTVSKREIQVYYNNWIKDNPDEQQTLDEMRDTIEWQLLTNKQRAALNSWIETLKDNADIEVDKKAIRIK